MTISLDDSNNQNVYRKSFYPDDINDMQIFVLNDNEMTESGKKLTSVRKLSVSFEKSSDFFGRIIIYHFEMLAWKMSIHSKLFKQIMIKKYTKFNTIHKVILKVLLLNFSSKLELLLSKRIPDVSMDISTFKRQEFF